VVTVLGRPGRGASQVEKSSHLSWATQFLAAYDGACSPNVCQIVVNFPWCLAFPEKKLDDRSHLDVVEIARCLTCFVSASVTREDLQFGT